MVRPNGRSGPACGSRRRLLAAALAPTAHRPVDASRRLREGRTAAVAPMAATQALAQRSIQASKQRTSANAGPPSWSSPGATGGGRCGCVPPCGAVRRGVHGKWRPVTGGSSARPPPRLRRAASLPPNRSRRGEDPGYPEASELGQNPPAVQFDAAAGTPDKLFSIRSPQPCLPSPTSNGPTPP